MRLSKVRTTASFNGRRTRRGFTLVELIVVLAILAILAAIGIGSIANYIDRSKFDKNSESAITVYQTAQTALSQKASNGSIDMWIRTLKTNEGTLFTSRLNTIALDQANESVNEILSLTYNPCFDPDDEDRLLPISDPAYSTESQELYAFLSSYFYDTTIFQGTITVEFDVSATYTVDSPSYTARVISAFYSTQNSPASGLRWDSVCTNNGATADGLPYRDATYRYKTSHVGYFNGTEESIKPQIASVFLPQSQVYELDGHIIGPTVDPTAETTGFLFNMRNGETLDISWAIFDEDGNGAAHDNHNENITITLSDAGVNNTGSHDDVVLTITADDLASLRYRSMGGATRVVHEHINNYDITRTSYDSFIRVTVNGGANKVSFPITVTLVEGDGRTGCPKKLDGETIDAYYEYSIAIDCMMIRSNESGTDGYNIRRLFGTTPTNIEATISGSFKYYDGTGVQQTRTIPPTYAARAINDPVYYTGLGTYDSNTSYCYDVRPLMAINDQRDYDHSISGDPITGKCIVNTLFGDATYSNSAYMGAGNTIAATEWTDAGKNAVITSFRHLYNIRWISNGITANYRIIRDLNWYINERGKLPVSEVRVFNTTRYNSPVTAGQINVVSFPALGNLYDGQTLAAMPKSGGSYYSINNVQMRLASFIRGTDAGYGLICKNSGTVLDVHTNNLNLVLASLDDGGNDLDSKIFVNSVNITGQSNGSGNLGNYDRPVGGLIGLNSGVVGQTDGSIVMSNSVVMANSYWVIYADVNKIATGGVIGKNESEVNGTVEVNGSFAVVGRDNVGGIIGHSTANIAARLLVNSTEAPAAQFTLPIFNNANLGGEHMSSVIISKNNVGGAIGFLQNASLTYAVEDPFTYSGTPENGLFTNVDRNDFQIDVTLKANSLIFMLGTYNGNNDTDRCSAGGAVGAMNSVGGNTASIRVDNSGSVIINSTGNTVYCGGVIGRDYDCSTSNVYIDFNHHGGRIGYFTDTSGPLATGGAYGQIQCSRTDRTIVINGVNSGTIVSRGNSDGQGTGGAIGGVTRIGEVGVSITFKINVVNNASSKIIATGSNETNANGTGGAIGAMGNSTANDGSTIPAASVIRVVNSGTINGIYHVGGAVGNSVANYGQLYAVNSGLINGNNYTGGTVGRNGYSNYGTIQSILETGAKVHGIRFTGGAAGRILNDQNGTTVRTIVRGNAEVIANNGSAVGGVCGDISVAGTGTDILIELVGDGSTPTLTISGNDGIGGVAGILRANVANSAQVKTPDQSQSNKLNLVITGGNYIGGALGALRSTSSTSTNPSDLIKNNATSQAIKVNVTVVLSADSKINATGDNVGGAIGYLDSSNAEYSGRIEVSFAGSSQSASFIVGKSNVGGAVGQVHTTKLKTTADGRAGIYVDFGVTTWKIEGIVAAGNDANVGGAVGFFNGDKNTASDTACTITVNLSTTNVTALGRNVGGAVGQNSGYNGNITVTALSGTVSGQINVGGIVGKNLKSLNEISITIQESGTVNATGETVTNNINGPSLTLVDANAGGAIGYDYASVVKTTAIVRGHIIGGGDNVGGAIGCIYATDKNQLLQTITATLQNSGVVQGVDNVGGAIGINVSNVDTVISEITGSSQVIGVNRVGGAVGFASATAGVGGGTVLAGNSCGRILYVSATISADLALVGSTQIGGAIGQVGNKWGGGNSYISAVVVRVQAVINAGRLFDTAHTGPSNASDDARVGGVVGHFVDGRLGMPVSGQSYDAEHTPGVYLRGSGGVVHTDYPNRTYNNTVLMAANGSTIGGIIGQIGLEGYQQNACVTTISADDGPYLCVASVNGGNRVGGWIGAGYAGHGGIGNENNTSNPVTYNVNNVRTVYSTGDEVGGFMGRLDSLNGNSTSNKGIYATINVNLSEANVTGRTQVGGVFGSFTAGWYATGSINVTLSNHSNIGDITGNPMPGDTTTYNPICYECGGAIGFVNSQNTGNYLTRLYIPIRVTSDATSRIWAGGTTSDAANPVTNFGVGGAFGRIYASMNGSTRVEVQSSSNNPDPVYVYSAYSNVGGIAGVWIDRGMITDAGKTDVFKENTTYANANVNVLGDGSDIGVGGFAGRIDNGYVTGCRVNGSVSSTGSNSNAGGFAGYIAGGTLTFDCTTTTVSSSSAGTGSTGGFVGYLAKGSISSSYVGGHTFQRQYISGEGNVTGISNVGGFVGLISGASSNTTIATCYSTASVLGTGQNIGGFVGNARQGKITGSYCGGLVTGSTNVGAYAGTIGSDMTIATGDGNRALRNVNGGALELVGGEDPRETGIVWADAGDIRNGANHRAHAFDSTLSTTFELRGVINSEHYGDWSLGSSGGTSINNATVTIDSGVSGHPNEFPYRRSGVTLTEDNISVVVEGVTLTEGTDYVLGYRDNDRIGTATVQIAGRGAYSGAISRTFEIVAADITSAEVILNSATEEYTGAPITPDITVKLAGETLVYNVDYYFTYDPDNTNIGPVEVTVHGIGNYAGTADSKVTFEIVGRDISRADIYLTGVDNLVYTGERLYPSSVIVRLDGVDLVPDVDYDISYENNINAGTDTAVVIITGKGSYQGTATKKYSIQQATNTWVEDAAISSWTWGDPRSIPTGRVQFGEVEFAYYSDAALQNEIDITQVGAGTYYLKAYVTETPNYTAPTPQSVEFTINRADIANAAVIVDPDEYEHTGQSIIPDPTTITVTVGTTTLEYGTDYTLSYPSDTTSAGVKTITITGIGNYTGTTTSSYEIYNVFTVTFRTGEGSSVEPQPVIENDYATRPADPTYEGYAFRGWYTSSSYRPEELFNFETTQITGNIDLWAKWQKVYVITFVTGDGGSYVAPQTVDSGSCATRPEEIPTREGYVFTDWYTDEACTRLYDFASSVLDNRSIYAGWAVTHTVTFDTGDGGSAVDPQVIPDGGTPTDPGIPTRDGYTFQYWAESAAEDAPEYNFSAPITGDVIIYAKWQEN